MNIFPFNEPLTLFATIAAVSLIGFAALLQIRSDLREAGIPQPSFWVRRWPTETLSAHRKLAPSSKLRAVYVGAQVVMVVLILSSIFITRQNAAAVKTQQTEDLQSR